MKQLAYRRMLVLVIVLEGFGSNDNRLMVWEKMDWMVFYSDCKHPYQRQLSAIHQVFEPAG